MTSSAAKRRATPTGAASWIKLRVIVPNIHWTRFACYGVRRLIAKSQATVETLGGRIFIEEFDPPIPNHIKIDVDGTDHLVLSGAERTLADPRLKSVPAELVGGERQEKAAALLSTAGFKLDQASQIARGNRILRR